MASSEENYRRNVRGLTTALWREDIGIYEFLDGMIEAIYSYYTRAWHEGAAKCGIKPDELTEAEVSKLNDIIETDISQHLGGFTRAIIEGNRASGSLLRPLTRRAKLWGNRYNAVRTRAQTMACADKKGLWVFGDTIQHCRSCSTFAGRVYRYSTWLANEAIPQSSLLCCHGYQCKCSIQDTDQRITPGPFPRSALCAE